MDTANLTSEIATNVSKGGFKLYNILSCKGFEVSEKVGISFGPCAKAKIVAVFLFFIVALVRKWVGEEMGVDFSFIGGILGALVPYMIVVSLTGSVLISFLAGIVGIVVFGFLGGKIFGGEGDY